MGGMFVLSLFLARRQGGSQRNGGEQRQLWALLAFPAVLTLVALFIGCAIGLARVYVGVHYPGDIIGGALDGLIAAVIVSLLRQWLRQPTTAILQFAQRIRLA